MYVLNLLSKKSADNILKIYDVATFEKGVMTNPINNSHKFFTDQKNLLELAKDGYQKQCNDIVEKSIMKSTQFYDYTCPKKLSGIKFLEYREGMYYREHNDSYMMGSIRSDFSCTIFLNDSTEYEGGELVLRVGNKEIEYKLDKGKALIYSTGIKHKVNPVLSGDRKVFVCWIESAIKNSLFAIT
jgi:PKHD-type hydroxylase